MYKYPYGDSQQLNLDWILAKLKELEAAGLGLDLEEVSNALISLTYNTNTAYRRYDYAFLNGKLYRCLSDTSGAFDPAAWQEALIGDDLSILTRWINAIDAAAVVDVKFDTTGTNGKIQQKYHEQYHDVVEVDYTPVQNSKRPLSSNAGYKLNGAIESVFNAGGAIYTDCDTFIQGLFKYTPATLNIPESGYGFVINYVAQFDKWKWQIAITTNQPVKIFIRNSIDNAMGGAWSAWKKIATEDDISTLNGAINGMTPQDITISAHAETTLASGSSIVGHCAANGVITISTSVVTLESGGGTSGWKPIGTIQAGYRPPDYVFTLAYAYGSSGVTATYVLRITTAGTIQVMALPNNVSIYFNITYQI